MTSEKTGYRPSFYFTINSLFVLLIVAVGAVLTWYNYNSTAKIVLAAAERSYDQASREVTLDFKRTYQPVFQTVNQLSFSPVTSAESLEERLEALEILSSALQSGAEIAGLQVGYDNGDYFIVRPLVSLQMRERFQAPDEASFVVDHIETEESNGERLLLRIFFNDKLHEVFRWQPVPTKYDPRTRPWYKQALLSDKATAVAPYLFHFSGKVGTTVSFKPRGAKGVLGADVTLGQLSETLQEHLLTPHSEIVIIDADGRALGYTKPEKVIIQLDKERFKIAHISDLESGVLAFIHENNLLKPGPLEFDFEKESWQGFTRTLNVSGQKDRDLTLLMISPRKELLADAIKMVNHSLLVTLLIILLSIPAASLVAAMISKALKNLAGEAKLISRFDFKRPITLRSQIREVDELARAMDLMKTTISRFLSLIKSLADEQNFDAMLEQITQETLNVSQAGAVLTCLVDEDAKTLKPGVLIEQATGVVDVRGLPSLSLDSDSELVKAAHKKETRHIQLSHEQHEDMQELLQMFVVDELVVTALPLKNRQEEVIGLLCLLNKVTENEAKKGAWEDRLDFVRSFSGFAAVSLESRQLFEMQKRLMDSFMHLLAGAIDAKSEYTGGHCQRVPVITKMLARAACDDEGLFKDYQLDEEGWEAVHLAGWLHDCGKVTTPEYVVDKATKLETIYDRIHEIRTRFEVLKRDAQVRYWEQVAGGGDREELRTAMEKEWQKLDDDFAFVAECNLGGEFMAQEKMDRLEDISKRTWTRTLDDRLGISWEEEKRKAREPGPTLPVEENVLADRQDHLIERNKNERMPEDNEWGFKLDVPEYRYNLGELYNLKVERGTLTAEERYKINDHIVQTIIMLEKLPYPKHLREVPELAGGHHETMIGTGYPKRLTGAQMSLTAKMMAIADIFEALTASDRPYKKAKKLSETIRIMNFFKKDQHIDPDLFELFLRSGVYLKYAEQYLDPEHVDEVDIESYLSKETEDQVT